MFGAIIGDIVGSPYEFHNIKTKEFPLFGKNSTFTDDTIMTCAVADWLMSGKNAETYLQKWGQKYINRTYEDGKVAAFGKGFTNWLKNGESGTSDTNGCVMRISPLLALNNIAEARNKGAEITRLTHNHPDSLNAVAAYLETGFMLKQKVPIEIIKNKISHKYKYNLSTSVDDIRQQYNKFYCTCKKSVPQAIICALDATSFEDALRNAVSLGGDSDTLACMAGGLAELRFSIPQSIKSQAGKYLDNDTTAMLNRFENNKINHTMRSAALSR